MEQLIPIASKLQDVLGALGQTTSLDLPQIVVVGGQSSGKSSVLEALVGRSFLPRGTGIVTRRPLILQLYNTSTGSKSKTTAAAGKSSGNATEKNSSKKAVAEAEPSVVDDPNRSYSSDAAGSGSAYSEWGEFLHLRGRKFYDFGAIRTEIVAETERLTGNNRGIDPTPIHLKIYSPHVLALTLVDLPGIAKVPVGDQPADIERQIKEMCLQYISNPNAIILAVTSANTDLANSDALQIAGSVDPSGNRTIGVLTKLDLMDPGTDCADILMNLVVPLRRGYIAVVNRGQKDVVTDLSIREGLKKEEKYFKAHTTYSRDRNLLAKCGSPRLAKTLNSILMHHIRDVLPDLKTRISSMMGDVQQELDALGSPGFNSSRSTRGAALLGLLSKFATNFGLVLDGHGAKDAATKNKHGAAAAAAGSELFGGARISYIFTDIFASSLTSVGAFDKLSDEEIRTTIRNANGTRPALFVPEISFDLLVRRQIARLEQPGIQCVDLVYEELQRIASQSEPSELTRFPVLRDRMLEVVSNLLRRAVNPTQLMVANLVKIELSYINTSHPDFIGGSRAVARLMEKIGSENETARAQLQQQAQRNRNVRGGGVPNSPLSERSSVQIDYVDANENEEYGHLATATAAAAIDTADGRGIMDFIFRGNQNAVNVNQKKANHGGANNNNSNHPGTKVARGKRESASTAGGGNGGPPSIVHLPQMPQTMKQTDVPPTERERVEMEVIKSLMESYFGVVQKNFIDMVPKTIMYFLVNHVRDLLQNELVSELYRDAEVGTLMQEADDIAERRQNCNEMKELLSKALDIVNDVRDFNTFK